MSLPETLARTNGVRLRYACAGAGPGVLMIQGVGVAGSGWRPQAAALADRFRVLTFDNRGIGASTRGPAPLTVDAMVEDALALADAAGMQRFHLVGHSLGGLVSLRLALLAPARVLSLSLLCTFADGRDGSGMSLAMLWRGLRTRVGTRRMRRQAMLDLIMPASYLQTVDREQLAGELQALFGRDLADSPPIVMEQLRAMARCRADGLDALAAVPTLVVSGGQDLIAPPRVGRALAAAIPGARFVELSHAAHALPIQCADELNVLLAAHLAAAGAYSST